MATTLIRGPKMKGMKIKRRVKVRKICLTTLKFVRREMRAVQSLGRVFQAYLWGKKNGDRDGPHVVAGAAAAE